MPTLSSRLPFRLISSALVSGALFVGCAETPSSIGPDATLAATLPSASRAPAEGQSATSDFDQLKTLSFSSLSPNQGLDAANLGARIRWAGAVQYRSAMEDGVCLTVLYAVSDDDGAPRWTNEPTYQSFLACTREAYDPALISEFTNLTIVGRITGKTSISMGGGALTGPVVQIEKIFRWSDCLERDVSPECKSGFLAPKTVPRAESAYAAAKV